MSIVLNGTGDCTANSKGSRVDVCSILDYGDFTDLVIHNPNIELDLAEMSEKEYWDTLIASRQLFPYNGIFNPENTTPENEVATSSSGLKMNVRDGKPEYTLTFPANSCIMKSLMDKKGKAWRIILGTDKGIMVGANKTQTKVFGFLASYFDVQTFKLKNGGDIQQVQVNFQIDSADEYNNFDFISKDQFDFNVTKLQGALNADLKVTAVAGTTIKVKVLSSCNGSVNYGEVLDDNTLWKANGVEPTAVSYSPATLEYSLTVGAMTAGTNMKVDLGGKDLVGNIYVGSASVTVGA